jgi:uncharacterized protein
VRRLAAITILLLSFAPLAAAQTPDPPSVVAQGEATVRRAADVAWVQIAVEARGASPDSARSQAASAMTGVVGVLTRSLPSDAVRTSSFSVQPEMEYPNNTPKVRGYVARNQIEVRVDDLNGLPAVLDASLSNGATSVAGLRFDVKNHDEAERQALQLAVADALARAQAIAAGAKRSLGEVIRITEQRSASGPIRPMAFADRAAGAPTPIIPGEIEIRAEVSLTVAIK